MQKKTVLVLTVQEAKDMMVKHFTNFLVSNPAHLSTLIRDGKLNELPNFATVGPAQVTQMFRDNQAGADLSQLENVDTVLVQNGVSLETVYEKPLSASAEANVIKPQEQSDNLHQTEKGFLYRY